MITKKILGDFREDFDKAMGDLEKKYGFKITLGSINYNDLEASGKVTIVDVGAGVANGLSAEQVIWNQNCEFFGFKKEDFGKEIMLAAHTYKIAGIMPNCRKNGIVIRDVKTNAQYKTSYDNARMALDYEAKKSANANA